MAAISKESLIIRNIPGFNNLRVVTGIDILNDFPKHIHNDCVVGIVTSGKRMMTVAGSCFSLTAGDIFIINPREPHSLQSSEGEPHSYMVLIIPDDILRMVASEIYGGGYELHFNNCINQDSESAGRFNELFSVLNDPDSLLESGSVLFSFLEFLVRYHSTCSFPANDKQSAGIVKIAEEYINQNFREQITLEDLSEIAGVSPFHLNRTFTAVTGISPHSYQIHRRIEFSKRLLLEGYSIAYVSAESGFTDQSHYTRFFKKITGTTPGRFLLLNRENLVQK